MRRTASSASGAFAVSASTKSLRRPWLQQAASVIGGTAPGLVELSEPGIGIGLQDAGISGEVTCGVFAVAIARVEEHRCWRPRSREGPIIAHIRPYPAGDRFAFGQDRHGRIVTMDTLGGEHVPADQLDQLSQSGGAGANPIG